MIPLQLTLKGIYSYRNQQTIDFASLTKNHLFGIFGPVGSGKSTILEAVTYALFGETERLNSRDGRNYNMMNLKSNELMLDFTFKAGRKNSDTYRFTVKGNRDKKDFNIVRALDRQAYKLEGTEWIPIENSNAEEIIGLSYENFRRTIIIPQGKFQEFLQLGEADRTRMMKEIFNLNRYDLSANTEIVERKTVSALEGVKGQLLQIGDVNQDAIDQESKQRDELKEKRAHLEKNIKHLEKTEKGMLDAKVLLEKVNAARKTVVELDGLAHNYKERELLVEQYEACQKNFPDLLAQRKDVQLLIANSSEKIKHNIKAIDLITKELRKDETDFIQVRSDYEKRHEIDSKCKELESLSSVLQIDSKTQTLESHRTKVEKEIDVLSAKIAKYQNDLKQADANLKKAKKEMPDEKKLLEIKRWNDRYISLSDDIERMQNTINDNTSELKSLEEEKKELLSNSIVTKYTTPAERKRSLDEVIDILRKVTKKCRSEISNIQSEIDSLTRTEVLETFAQELRDGEPCILCGSKEHPNKYVGRGVKTKVEGFGRDKRNLDKDAEGLQDIIQQFVGLKSQIESAAKSVEKANEELKAKKAAFSEHEGKYSWKDFSRKDIKIIDGELERADRLNDEIENLDSEKEKLQENINNTKESIDQKREQTQDLKTELSELSGTRKTLIAQIKHIKQESFDNWNQKTITKEIQRLKEDFRDIEVRYKALDESIRKKKDHQSTLSGQIKVEEDNLQSYTTRLQSIEEELNKRLQNTGFEKLSFVETLLAKKLDVRKEKDVIRAFNERLSSAKDHLIKLEQESKGVSYNEAKHLELQNNIDQLKEDSKQLSQDIGRLENSIREMNASLAKKLTLEDQRIKLERKAENVTLLKRLFRGGGFVNYASRIYLENLCGIANQRFIQLTRQKLKLELRDDNAFEVRDFLNDGKLRSVKTLSGGQTFQASLSLALSLADNLQQFAKTEENFFFLDEGFGTLDKDSLQMVFEALKSLRLENRVVGVISHLEELQQEIDNYIKIELDPNQGSLVVFN
ncbi:MAG: SMC family ATPase [Ignavibacteriae bacterium]|nr:SMC family ATPase [Ignavibacteriota bacterium]